jgi:hypothetical protein
MVEITLGGGRWEAGRFPHDYRMRLMSMHLGDALAAAGVCDYVPCPC